MIPAEHLKQLSPVLWEIRPSYKPGMRVPARIYATEKLFKEMDEGVFDQVTNVATLPGIVQYAICMPDGHWGYGFPIGGVAAFDLDEGVISPGGIGFDINCGMRLVRTNLQFHEVVPKLEELITVLFKSIPAGVGVKGFVKISQQEFKKVMEGGARWCVENGYGWPEDLERLEERGAIRGADPEKVSKRAVSRGFDQLGTLGSGNHYLEVQRVNQIFDREAGKAFGIDRENQIVIMVHCGSRGFGHQVATDYLQAFLRIMPRYGIEVRDRELAAAPYRSKEGQDYFAAMVCAANSAFANRQIITHRIREGFQTVFKADPRHLGLEIVYDVCHNIAKVEEYEVAGKQQKLLIHRKGATRSFGPGQPEVTERYRDVGQPVIVGGSMETGSYLLAGTKKAMEESFGSTLHGSGRTMSRVKARKQARGQDLQKKMKEAGIIVKSVTWAGLAEEAGFAYKDISEVIETVHEAGISKKVAELKPLANIKG